MRYERLEIGVGERPTMMGSDVLYCDAREVQTRPLVVCDVFGTLPFPSGAFRHVVANHVLEHCSHMFTETVLREWKRILRSDGLIHLEVPNLYAYAQQLVRHPGEQKTIEMIYGYQSMPNDLNTHRAGFTEALLSKALRRTGFQGISVQTVGFVLIAEGWASL